jgi:hypothetical protein
MRFRTLIVAIVILVSLDSVQAATLTVTNTLDAGAGSLRQAMFGRRSTLIKHLIFDD